jgi:hypothetical protein
MKRQVTQYVAHVMEIKMHVCKDYCKEYKALMPRYLQGKNKRCTPCELFLTYPGIYCPCCGEKLRTVERKRRVRTYVQ